MFVQTAGKTYAQKTRKAADEVDAVASPLTKSHIGYGDASTTENRLSDDSLSLSMTE